MENLAEIHAFTAKSRESEIQELKDQFGNIVEKLRNPAPNSLSGHFFTPADSEMNSVQKWITGMLEYNLVDGKLNRAVALASTYKLLKADRRKEDTEQVAVLGWCIEMFQTYFLILDDIMDGSITRRGKPCWYKNNDVGMIAVNDATILQSLIFDLLRREFKDASYYGQLMALFNEAFRITAYGQCLDVLTEKDSKMTINNNVELNVGVLTEERYKTIVKYKTSFYSFVLPIRLAMYASGIVDEQLHSDVERILLRIGHIFQVQDDYLDCYADAQVLGKIGTDIRDAKCSWLIVTALQYADEQCLLELTRNYGIDNEQSERIVKDIYNRLQLTEHYNRTIDKFVKDIFQQIDNFNRIHSGKLPAQFFYQPLAQIFKRQK